MIESLRIRGFKCFRDSTVHLGALTVLAGGNSTGKSSAIQALLLAEQSAKAAGESNVVALNGPHALQLGTVLDVVPHAAKSGAMQIDMQLRSGRNCEFSFVTGSEQEQDHFLRLAREVDGVMAQDVFHPEKPLSFIYLCAERQGPRDTQAIQSLPLEQLALGTRGEFVAHVLDVCETDRRKVRQGVSHLRERETKSPNLLVKHQLELWTGDMVGPLRVTPSSVPGTNVTYLRIACGNLAFAEPERPTNIGFGVSYVLPIVLAGLVVPENGIFIVENPEAHLHPAAQSKMAEFLTTVAAAGVQVIVETHSDHILNGIRLAVKSEIIAPDGVRFNYFVRDEGADGAGVAIQTPSIDSSGRIDNWPPGFFDQITSDLERLFGI